MLNKTQIAQEHDIRLHRHWRQGIDDASIMLPLVSPNTNDPTLMIAERRRMDSRRQLMSDHRFGGLG